MAKKAKKIMVEDILNLMQDDEKVVVHIFAYGIHAADTYRDGMRTAKDCRENMNYDCLRAQVGRISRDSIIDDPSNQFVSIAAEVVH